ncbi:MAG: hypothetical protein Q8P67_21395 [archaeon]|nr:hypothetical protein [archaeon]
MPFYPSNARDSSRARHFVSFALFRLIRWEGKKTEKTEKTENKQKNRRKTEEKQKYCMENPVVGTTMIRTEILQQILWSWIHDERRAHQSFTVRVWQFSKQDI